MIQQQSGAKPQRLNYLDWLRVGAVLLLVPFHTSRVFDIWEDFYVKNDQLSSALSYFIAFAGPWFMPLLFMLAGASTWLAMRSRSGKQYAGERFKRLLVPFLAGMILIIPPQACIALHKDPGYNGSYFDFFPQFFNVQGDLSGYTGLFTPGHLWFILYLFCFSLVALPLFLYLKSERGQRLLDGFAGLFQKRWTIFLLAIPVTLTQALPGPDGKGPVFFLSLFILGFVIMASPRLYSIVLRERRSALILGVLFMAGHLALVVAGYDPAGFSAGDIIYSTGRTFLMLFCLLAATGYGEEILNRDSRVLRYLSESSYPFYILHQTVILAVAYFVVRWDLSLWPKFFIIMALTLVFTFGLYEVVVRRTNFTRFLFGMKARKPKLVGTGSTEGVPVAQA